MANAKRIVGILLLVIGVIIVSWTIYVSVLVASYWGVPSGGVSGVVVLIIFGGVIVTIIGIVLLAVSFYQN